MEPTQILQHIIFHGFIRENRNDIAQYIYRAYSIVDDFAIRNNWASFFNKVRIDRFNIFASEELLCLHNRIDVNPIHDAGSSVLAFVDSSVLSVVAYEEAHRLRPEYIVSIEDWIRLIAHELVHCLHFELVKHEETKMGPIWFYEGFAMFGARQNFDAHEAVDIDHALRLTQASGRGSYKSYYSAFKYFSSKASLDRLIQISGHPDFESALRKL